MAVEKRIRDKVLQGDGPVVLPRKRDSACYTETVDETRNVSRPGALSMITAVVSKEGKFLRILLQVVSLDFFLFSQRAGAQFFAWSIVVCM